MYKDKNRFCFTILNESGKELGSKYQPLTTNHFKGLTFGSFQYAPCCVKLAVQCMKIMPYTSNLCTTGKMSPSDWKLCFANTLRPSINYVSTSIWIFDSSLSHITTFWVKVDKSQKQCMVSSILQKKWVSFFLGGERIEKNIICFLDCLTFSKSLPFKGEATNVSVLWICRYTQDQKVGTSVI